jgi:hypothetical protein
VFKTSWHEVPEAGASKDEASGGVKMAEGNIETWSDIELS